jgi:pyruvate/2-oxoglutarate/acetoin dehydrogenase E1 component
MGLISILLQVLFVFKITNGFTQEFGKDRVRNTPLCESAIVGIGLGFVLAVGAERVMSEVAANLFSYVATQQPPVFRWDYAAGDVAEAGRFDVQFVAAFTAGLSPARTFVAQWEVRGSLE